MVIKFFHRLFGKDLKNLQPKDVEWESFQQALKQQFKKLSLMGIGLPIMVI